MLSVLLNLEIRQGQDIVLGRQRARQLARLLGFERPDQIRIATAVSELIQDLLRDAVKGQSVFLIRHSDPSALLIELNGWNASPERLQEVLDSRPLPGRTLEHVGAHSLMDEYAVEVRSGLPVVILGKVLPSQASPITQKRHAELLEQIARLPTREPYEELQKQNEELLVALSELQKRQKELTDLNRELEDTNRGVVALYSELDERATGLRRVSDLKTRFLSNMTHEFRTPLNAILNLSRMLLDRIDGELTTEQEKQVLYIRRAASDLTELVNDLLDLAKVEAGKTEIRLSHVELSDVFGALRGMMRPLASQNPNVALVFEEPVRIPAIETDESKFSQILRNFVSNALKYTEHGEVRVSATQEGENIIVFVSDSGIGIASHDLDRIFEEFSQIAGPHQAKVKGTGLGLPLSKKLAELLGGTIRVQSKIGKGSTFSVSIPLRFKRAVDSGGVLTFLDFFKDPVLIATDQPQAFKSYQERFRETRFSAVPISNIDEFREVILQRRPLAIIMDVFIANQKVWQFLAELKRETMAEGIPIWVIDGINNRAKAIALGADEFHASPVDEQWLFERIDSYAEKFSNLELLVIDDDSVSRYLLRSVFVRSRFKLIEAEGGFPGLTLARDRQPAAIFLDLEMPDMNGQEVLQALKSDPATQQIPVILHTSKMPSMPEQAQICALANGILPKHSTNHVELMERVRSLLAALLASDRARKEAVHHD